jgi:hypothetical protein
MIRGGDQAVEQCRDGSAVVLEEAAWVLARAGRSALLHLLASISNYAH